MSYTKTDWVNNVTPVDDTRMDKIEQGIFDADAAAFAAVAKDSVVVAATRIVASKLLAGDAQPAFRISGDGKQEWGPGGATNPDTNLYRSAAYTLSTDSDFDAFSVASQAGSATNKIKLSNNGRIEFGSPADTNLYRYTADLLRTDDTFAAPAVTTQYTGANQIQLSADGKIYFGSAADTDLYRSSAGTLATTSAFYVNSSSGVANLTKLYLNVNGVTKQVYCGADNSGGAGFKVLMVSN